MIDALMLAPCMKVLAALLVVRLAWWVLGDFILDHVGIPFLDAGWSRNDAKAAVVVEMPEREAVARVVRWLERPAGVRIRTSHVCERAGRAA